MSMFIFIAIGQFFALLLSAFTSTKWPITCNYALQSLYIASTKSWHPLIFSTTTTSPLSLLDKKLLLTLSSLHKDFKDRWYEYLAHIHATQIKQMVGQPAFIPGRFKCSTQDILIQISKEVARACSPLSESVVWFRDKDEEGKNINGISFREFLLLSTLCWCFNLSFKVQSP